MMKRISFVLMLCLAALAATLAEAKDYSIKGFTMTTARVGTAMEASKLVLSGTLPNDTLLVLPFVVSDTASGMTLLVKFNGAALTSFTAGGFVEGTPNLLNVDITSVAGKTGELEITLTSTEPGSLVFVQDLRVPDAWPWYYNGTEPDPKLNLGVNNIATYDASTARLYSCVKWQTNGQPSTRNGVARFDIAFEVKLAQNTVKVLNTRPFNPTNAKTLTGLTPDCTGVYETTTGLYTDTIQVGANTYRVSFSLFDGTGLQLRIVDAKKVQ